MVISSNHIIIALPLGMVARSDSPSLALWVAVDRPKGSHGHRVQRPTYLYIEINRPIYLL